MDVRRGDPAVGVDFDAQSSEAVAHFSTGAQIAQLNPPAVVHPGRHGGVREARPGEKDARLVGA